MPISDKTLTQWVDHFYGYGSWNSKFWFVGYEEGGGEVPEEVAEKFNYFYKVPIINQATLCDIRELYRHITAGNEGTKANLFTNLYEYRFGNNAVQHSVWKNIISFVHGYQNENLPDLLAYQQNSFASQQVPNEAWIKLYPLPSPHNHAWYYRWLDLPQVDYIRSRTSYQEHVYPKRISSILSHIRLHKPEVVVMYGMDNINKLKRSVCDFFEDTAFRMIKATKQQIPQHHRADFNGTTIVITSQIPALRHNRIETGFDWQAFGKVVALRT